MPDKGPSNIATGASRKYFYLLLGVVVAAFIFMLGYSLGGQQTKQAATGGSGKSAAYEQAVGDLKQKLTEAGLLMPLGEVRGVSGKITAIGEDYIEIEANPLTNNPLEEPTPIKRRVVVSPDTKIFKTEPLSPADSDKLMQKYLADQQKFQAAITANKEAAPPTPPKLETVTDLKLSDLAKDDVVYAVSDKDIARSESFTAIEIRKLGSATDVVGAGVPPAQLPPGPNMGGAAAGFAAPTPPPPVPPTFSPPPPPPPPTIAP
jgi:hypothetical protein